MLNLVIDIGNSRTKVAVFNQEHLMISFRVTSFTPSDLKILLNDYPGIKSGIVSSVRDNQDLLLDSMRKLIPYTIELNHTTPIPIGNCYETPETLGKDRIAAVVGANKLYPRQNILVIDAGTAITYDFINDKNQFVGGFISPGLTMRFKALNYFTDKLPLLKPEISNNFKGITTADSIKGGVQFGMEGELNRMISYFTDLYGKLTIILTGGDANYFEKLFKNYNFVNHEITLLGLNTILEFNYIKSCQDKKVK
jgi:type III pantothenate kinase